jgi:hypothetical protein
MYTDFIIAEQRDSVISLRGNSKKVSEYGSILRARFYSPGKVSDFVRGMHRGTFTRAL